jgi:uncharacterized peroxidase-related enzyme
MTQFQQHTPETTSAEGREVLDRAQRDFGFAPNLLKVLAEAPAAGHAYLDLGSRLGQSSLSPAEQQVVLLATSFENECDYCMAAHSTVAGMVAMDEATRDAIRKGETLPDARLNALWQFTRSIVRQRGRMSASDLEAFLDAGFTRANILEVLLGVAMKTLSNYTNHLADTPLDEAFEAQRWSPPGRAAAD